MGSPALSHLCRCVRFSNRARNPSNRCQTLCSRQFEHVHQTEKISTASPVDPVRCARRNPT